MSGSRVVGVEGLTVRPLAGGGPIVDGLTFDVEAGRMTALVGESGAGKSISTKAVLGVLDERAFAVSGAIELCGSDLTGLSQRERRRRVSDVAALVFQNPARALNPTMRIGAQITESMLHAPGRPKRSRAEAHERAVELMRQVGIAAPGERFHAYPHQLSGGMKQRAVIAIALALEPKVLFCDEPTSSLDVTTQALIMDLLDELRTSLGLGILFITHDLVLAASRADEVLVLHAGRLVERLPAQRLFEQAAMPYTRALLARVPGREPSDGPAVASGRSAGTGADDGAGCHYAPDCPRAQEICRVDLPPLAVLGAGHTCRCWFPVGRDPIEETAAEESGARRVGSC